MRIQTQVLTNLPVFKVGDSLKKVIRFFKGHTYSHIAVVEKGRFLGVLSETDVASFEADKKVEDQRYGLEAFFVRKETNWLDVLEAFARNEANLLPILGVNEEVVGYYDLAEVVAVFIDIPFFTEPGGVLVVSKAAVDYSFSEIAQIVENSDARLFGGFITAIHDEVVQITLKIGTTNLNEIIQTFRRYDYNILFDNKDDQFLESLKERSDYLNKYLNV